jgi:toxin ParE1/3/4
LSLPVIVRDDAKNDIRHAVSELESARAELGKRFLRQVRELLERIELTPELYGFVWQDVRAARVKPFPYIVYYVAFVDRVDVLAVMHGMRDANVWRSRHP